MRATRAYENLRRAICSVVPDAAAPIADVVDAGYVLHLAGTLLRHELQRIKFNLRLEAKSRACVLEGSEATASVATPESILKMAKDADVEALRKALGDDFGEFFKVQTILIPVPETFSRVLALPSDIQDLVFRSIEQDVGQGGVTFNPKRKP